jgi:hypothetical protein
LAQNTCEPKVLQEEKAKAKYKRKRNEPNINEKEMMMRITINTCGFGRPTECVGEKFLI